MGLARKPVSMHLAKNLPVAIGPLNAGDLGITLKAGESALIHADILTRKRIGWAE